MGSNKTTDTKTTQKVKGNESAEGRANTAAAGAAAGSATTPRQGFENEAEKGADSDNDPSKGPQTVAPSELAGQKGEHGGAIALREEDIQGETQQNAAGDGSGKGEPEEFIEVGPGRVQSTKPVNDPPQ